MADAPAPGPVSDGEPDGSSGLLDAASPAPESTRLGLLILARLRPLWPWLVLAGITWAGWFELKKTDVATVEGLLHGTDGSLWLLLLAVTAVNLAVFGLYDVAALGRLSEPPSPRARWAVGMVSFAWSNFLTVGPLAGPALRLWLYRPLGVTGTRSRAALTSILAAFTAALLAWCAAVTAPLPDGTLARLALLPVLVLPAALVLRLLPRARLAPPSVKAWEGNPLVLAAVGAVDWLLAWTVFHLAVSGLHGAIDVTTTMRAFFVGQLVGLISFIPGGLGSADAYWLVTLGEAAGGHDRILAALVLYRLVYYVLPWAFATLVLAGRLVPVGRRTGAFIRTAIASYAFLCGAILLVSAATPSLADRAAFLRRTIPLALVEVSHGLSVVFGFLMLVISRGLARGYRSSHRLALAFFMAGTVTTFLKGFDFEEAFLSLSAVAVLLLAHRPFDREGRLRPPAEFVLSVAAFAVLLFAAVGFGSQPSVPDVSAAFSRFGYLAHGPRFERALILLAALASVLALHFVLRSRAPDRLPSAGEIDRALEEARSSMSGTNAMLVASGDKAIFRPGGGDGGGFIAYRTAGRFLVAFSDPVGPPRAQRSLLASFLDHAAEVDREVILYQITPSMIPVAHDFGFTFFKLGEEAIVDLSRFDLKGNKARKWRHAVNAVEKGGGSFAIVEGEPLVRLMPELRRVSDAWLAEKHLAEKRFSIGRFDERYLLRFPAAIVRDASGRVVAFANILEGRPGEEMSVDLMRYAQRGEAGGVHDVMDYLFIRLMLVAKERGFHRFNLGMAPLAAVGEERWARPFERLAHFFFRHGEQWYNYQGLRQYKEKFDPVWEPRYMAYPRPWDWPLAVTSTAALIAGGWRSLFSGRGEGA